MERKGLQIVTAILCCVPVTMGTLVLWYSLTFRQLGLPPGSFQNLDSDFRYFGGLWLGLGIAGFWLIPNIERQTALFRTIWGAIFLGGIGRVISAVVVGVPDPLFLTFMVLELSAPFFLYWHYRVVRAANASSAIRHDGREEVRPAQFSRTQS